MAFRLVRRCANRLRFESLESRSLLTSLSFSPGAPSILGTGVRMSQLAVGDFDGDRDDDLITFGDSVAAVQVSFFENAGRGFLNEHKLPPLPIGAGWNVGGILAEAVDLDGNGAEELIVYSRATRSEFQRGIAVYSIGTNPAAARLEYLPGESFAETADIDSDGDLDIRTTSAKWFENTRSNLGFVPRGERIGILAWWDIDSDGDQDLVASTTDGLIYRLNDRGNFGPPIVFDNSSASSLHVVDFESDGISELVATHSSEERIESAILYRSVNDVPTRQSLVELRDVNVRRELAVFDFDVDGDRDIVFVGTDVVTWIPFDTDQRQLLDTQKTTLPDGFSSGAVRDVDFDGDFDLLGFGFEYLENQGRESFVNRRTAFRARDSQFTDLDGNGSLEFIVALGNSIVQYDSLTDTTSTVIWNRKPLFTPAESIDLNGDGYPDWLAFDLDTATKLSNLFWVDGSPNSDGRRTVLASYPVHHRQAPKFRAVDWDGDGDVDVTLSSGTLSWFENLDGRGTFSAIHRTNIALNHTWRKVDIDRDGRMDVVTDRRGVTWYRPTIDPDVFEVAAEFSVPVSAVDGAIQLADFDRDRDLDFLVAIARNELVWLEITTDAGFVPRTIVRDFPANGQFRAADLDRDGDRDIVGERRGQVVTFENLDGQGSFSDLIRISSKDDFELFVDIAIADIDGDQDLDIVTAGLRSKVYSLSWYENLNDGTGFGRRQLITQDVLPYGNLSRLQVADINRDGRLDISYPRRISWAEIRPFQLVQSMN